jgi:hypothetical protein
MFNPVTKTEETVNWKPGDHCYTIPKRAVTAEYVASVWPIWVFLPDSMRQKISDSQIQSVNNPDAEWPSNTHFQDISMWPSFLKHEDAQRNDMNDQDGSRDVFALRLADTYLLAAEACHLLGDNNKAAEYINVVRRRAAVPGKEAAMEIAPSVINIDFILEERARELCGEFHRFYDLKRTGKLYERLNNPIMNSTTTGMFKEFQVLRPIPRDQLSRLSNPQDFPQNPGYGD